MEPDFSVTMARLVSLRLPAPNLVRRVLPCTVQRVDRGDLDTEDLLDGELDLGLVRARVDDEGVLALVDQAVALLGDDRRDDDVARVLVERGGCSCGDLFLLGADLAATNASNAALVKTMSSETSTSYALSWSEGSTCTVGRLRTLLSSTSSSRSRTTRTLLRRGERGEQRGRPSSTGCRRRRGTRRRARGRRGRGRRGRRAGPRRSSSWGCAARSLRGRRSVDDATTGHAGGRGSSPDERGRFPSA